MGVVLDSLRDLTKDTTSHLSVAAFITFAGESEIVKVLAIGGVCILGIAWAYHIYKLKQEKEEVSNG